MKKTTVLFKVQYQFEGDDNIYQSIATSAGLASLDADLMINILDIKMI